MEFSDVKILPARFAENGTAAEIPATQQAQGRASYDTGFPEETQLPIEAGGLPPVRADFNGAYRDLSSHLVYLQAGQRYKFSAAVAASGGYAQGSILAYDNPLIPAAVRSLVDNNTDNFNADVSALPANWTLHASGPTDYNTALVYVPGYQVHASNGNTYRALVLNGPNTGAGVVDPATNPATWQLVASPVPPDLSGKLNTSLNNITSTGRTAIVNIVNPVGAWTYVNLAAGPWTAPRNGWLRVYIAVAEAPNGAYNVASGDGSPWFRIGGGQTQAFAVSQLLPVIAGGVYQLSITGPVGFAEFNDAYFIGNGEV